MILISQILERKPPCIHTISAEATLHEAAMAMNRYGVSSLLVQAEEVSVGILSERDIVCRLALAMGAVYHTPVWQAMHEISEVDSDQDVSHAMALMTDRKIRHLIVREHGDIVGVISIGDLVKAYIDEQAGAITSLGHYIIGVPD
jgi:CBS domain-containing protein